jgi:peptidylprolyl isomerase
MSEVRNGDRVKVRYTGRLPNGEVFDSTSDGEPLAFTVGANEVIDGVDAAVLGMKVGEKKEITIPPAKAYGDRHDDLISHVPIELLPEGAKIGDQLQASGEGHDFVVWIAEIGEKEITVDANHPLAGETLIFDIEIVEHTPAPAPAP